MPEIGIAGLVAILMVALLVFGPRRLPEIGRSLGKGMREFKDSITGKDEKSEAACPASGGRSAKPTANGSKIIAAVTAMSAYPCRSGG